MGVFGIKTETGGGLGEKEGNVGWKVGEDGEDRTANTLDFYKNVKGRKSH